MRSASIAVQSAMYSSSRVSTPCASNTMRVALTNQCVNAHDRKPFGAAGLQFRCADSDPVGELAVETVDERGVGLGEAA
jgi:hypothetical protein